MAARDAPTRELRPFRLPKDRPDLRLLLLGGLILLIIVTNVVVAVRATQVLLRDMETLNVTHRNLEAISQIMSLLHRITNLERGYRLSGEERYVEQIPAVSREVRGILAQLRRSTAGDPRQAERVQQISRAIDAHLANTLASAADARERQRRGEVSLPSPLAIDDSVEDIAALAAVMRRHEESALRVYTQQFDMSRRAALSAMVVPNALTIILLAVAVYSLMREERLKEAIRRQEHDYREWLRVTLETLSDGVIAVNAEGKITLYNPAAEKLCGVAAERAAGTSIDEVCITRAEETNEHCDNPARRVLRTGTAERDAQRLTIRRADGEMVPISYRSSPILSGEGHIQGAVMVFSDVSDARRRELERDQLLEHERAARDLAETANRAKDDFLSLISHELRTPLQAILGWSEMLGKQHDVPPALQNAVTKIQKNAAVQAQLVEDLLDMSRIVNGRFTLRLEEVALDEIVRSAIAACMATATAKGIDISLTAVPGAFLVRGDRNRLQQISWNLLSNAVKFTPEGGHVRVALDLTDATVELRVTDDGIGIIPASLPHVCEPYWQANTSITRTFGGLGLGLSIVKSLVQLHGGILRVSSEGEGKGTTAIVTLPRAHNGQRPAHTREQPRHDPQKRALAGRRMLVVDDEADLRDLLAEVFEEQGARVDTAASVQEGLGAVSNEKFDIIICDIGMPHEDGYSLVQKIRERERVQGSAHTPIIALTAFARPEDQVRAYDVGFDVHLAKPVAVDELLEVVQRAARQ